MRPRPPSPRFWCPNMPTIFRCIAKPKFTPGKKCSGSTPADWVGHAAWHPRPLHELLRIASAKAALQSEMDGEDIGV